MNCQSASHLMSLTVQSFLKSSSLLGSDSLNRERIGKDKAIPLTEQKKKAGFFQKVGAVQALMSKWEVAIALQMNRTWRLPLMFDWKLWKSPSFGGLSWLDFSVFFQKRGGRQAAKGMQRWEHGKATLHLCALGCQAGTCGLSSKRA